MKRLLIPLLVLASLLSAQAARADQPSQPAPQPVAASQEQQAPAQPVVIAWDRVGDKLKGWV